MPCIIFMYLYPPFYPPFCFNSEINLLRARAPARRRHVVGQYGYLLIRIADVKKVSTTTSIMRDTFKTDRLKKMQCRSHKAVPKLRFIGLCDRGTLRHVRLCLTTPFET